MVVRPILVFLKYRPRMIRLPTMWRLKNEWTVSYTRALLTLCSSAKLDRPIDAVQEVRIPLPYIISAATMG